MAWILRVDSDGEAVDLPDGWISCNGSVIPEGSIWAGKQVPDLNGERRFLRGGSEEEMLTLEDDQILEHEHNLHDPGHTHPYKDIHYDDTENDDGPQVSDHQVDSYRYPFTFQTSKSWSGVSVGLVQDTVLHGDENRPINMGIIWIMRVW